MDISGELRVISHSVLKKGWQIVHELDETKTIEEYANVLFSRFNWLIPGDSAVVAVFDPFKNLPIMDKFCFSDMSTLSEQRNRDFENHYWSINPATKTFGNPRYMFHPFTQATVQTNPPYMECEFYKDFFDPMGFGHSMGLNYYSCGRYLGGFSVNMAKGKRDFNQKELASIALIRPGMVNSFVAKAYEGGLYGPLQNKSQLVSDGEAISPRAGGLTQREQEIALLVMDGKRDLEIGAILNISRNTVRAHLTNIFGKTGVRNRAGLITRMLFAEKTPKQQAERP